MYYLWIAHCRDSFSPRPLQPFRSLLPKWKLSRCHVSSIHKCLDFIQERYTRAKKCQVTQLLPFLKEESTGQERRQSQTQLFCQKVSSVKTAICQEVGGKPEKKRAALAHFDTIFGFDQVMVQLTIRAVLVSLLMMMIKKKKVLI